MPSVGTRPVVSSRRSTRVFVPKSGSALRSDQLSPVSTARFHSTKRENGVADSDWPCLSSAWNKENIENTTVANGHGPASVGEGERPSGVHSEERDDKTVDIVYKRKRPRQKAESSNSNNGENKRFGIVFSRQKRNKRSKMDQNIGNGLKILENGRTHEAPREEENKLARLVMIARVDSSSNSSRIFLGFLLSILRWMRRNSRARIEKLIALLMNGPIEGVFSMHGVQLSSMHEGKDDVVPGNYIPPHLGFCKLYSSSNSIPILSQNFSCLPSFFISLNLTVSLSSLYISPFLKNPTSSLDDDDDDDIYFNPPITIQTSSKPKNHPSPFPEPSRTLRSSSSFKQNQQKKRTASNRNNNSIRLKTYFSLNSHRPKPLELPPDESSQSGMDSDVSTPRGKNRRSSSSSLKSPVMRVQERLALAEAKQNIDSVRCKANILVTLEDRCYREDDVILSIEHSSESDDWLICVTLQDNSKFKHKPSEMRPCVVNRYTHAYMWTVDDVMRLEFIEKFDWLLFKELHAECRLRNSLSSSAQVKVKEAKPVQIPIPGVVEVEGYEAESRLDRPFVLPELYISVLGDEVERAMGKKSSIYEADSGDERWIDGFNGEGIVRVSLEEFEWLVSLFEKDAYVNNGSNNGHGENSEYNVGEIDGVINRCKELERGDADVVAAVYDYWMKKRGTKGGAPLIRCFQGGRTRRVEWCQKPYLKKKRSFKRQRSQVTRVKSEPFFHDWAEEEAMRRLNEARAAANRALQVAIEMRTRAQNIMEQADLAMYRAHMAYRIADAKSSLSRSVANPDPDFDPFPLP